MQTISLGPLAVPTGLLLFFGAVGAVGAGWYAGARLAHRGGAGFDLPAYAVLGCGLLAARIGFVLAYRDAYLGDPLSMLNLRDGGWSAVVGLSIPAAARRGNWGSGRCPRRSSSTRAAGSWRPTSASCRRRPCKAGWKPSPPATRPTLAIDRRADPPWPCRRVRQDGYIAA